MGSNAANKSHGNSNANNAVKNGAIATDGSGHPLYPLNANSQPIYPTASSTAAGSAPSLGSSSSLSCGSDPFTPSSSNADTFQVRSDHPRLFAPAYRWSCLPNLIANDPYMAAWNDTIFQNASQFAAMDPQPYTFVSSSERSVYDLRRLAALMAACPEVASWIQLEKSNSG